MYFLFLVSKFLCPFVYTYMYTKDLYNHPNIQAVQQTFSMLMVLILIDLDILILVRTSFLFADSFYYNVSLSLMYA